MSQKSSLHSGKKAYLQIDFILAFSAFFLFFIFVFSYYSNYKNAQDDSFLLTKLGADAKDLCTMLISTSGYPTNWEQNSSTATFIGLKKFNDTTLDANKIGAIANSTYFEIADTFKLESFVYLTIDGVNTKTSYLTYGSTNEPAYSGSYSCYSYHNNETVKVFVEVWR